VNAERSQLGQKKLDGEPYFLCEEHTIEFVRDSCDDPSIIKIGPSPFEEVEQVPLGAFAVPPMERQIQECAREICWSLWPYRPSRDVSRTSNQPIVKRELIAEN
jgi:hypothetical protein